MSMEQDGTAHGAGRAVLAFVTGGSGGIGKSGNARMLAAALGGTGRHVVLVDGNAGQQSQRVWHRLGPERMLENAQWLDTLDRAILMPRRTGQAYALLPGPADPLAAGMNDLYGAAILRLCETPGIDLVLVDADRIDPAQWEDRRTFAGHVIRPFMEAGLARMLFRIGQTGSQLEDGMRALGAVDDADMTCAVAVAAAGLAHPRTDRDWARILAPVARYAGTDRWDVSTLALQTPGSRLTPPHTPWLCRQAAFLGLRLEPAAREQAKGWWPWRRTR
ncbi:hypothetical protein D2E22_0305 [Bifidobacterium castoris]|uniref:CobQ/CobB/MinD/ParA nucleotide binding domain-containing protein n=2 Tax=Bifidobacterium castoris TaxID=2306972 RepID=A0A430FAI2_9BIFI|nr:hypothetical protein D2E22_0305 [Bifidobacterium castoris]